MRRGIAFLCAAAFSAAFSLAAEAQDSRPGEWVPRSSYVDAATGENYDIVVGAPDAPVTIFEYASLTCPHCRAFHQRSADDLVRRWIETGKAKLVYRAFSARSSGDGRRRGRPVPARGHALQRRRSAFRTHR